MTDSSVPNLLKGDNLTTWAALATVLEWLPAALDAPLVRDFELTHFEYGILFALADAPNQTLGMTVLAGYANSSLSRLSRAVSRIEGRGWVQRSRDPLDGRSTLASLTEAGLAMVEKATPVHSHDRPTGSAARYQSSDPTRDSGAGELAGNRHPLFRH